MAFFNKNRWFWTVLIVVMGTVLFFSYRRPLPPLQPPLAAAQTFSHQSGAASLPWPAYGQAAFGAVGYGMLASHNADKPAPMASTAKVITALAVLKQKPLDTGQQGPTITLTSSDAALVNKYYALGGSVVPVAAGDQITQLQALQAMLLPSANNMADSLAIWAFGSLDNYLKEANQYVKQLGAQKTVLYDASGLSPQTTSTAGDLVILGEAALNNPILAGIVSQPRAIIPIAGTVTNLNWLLGEEGVIGIKTGNTDEAGGCFLVAANRQIEGRMVKVIGAIMGAPNRDIAIEDSKTLVKAGDRGFETVKPVTRGQVVGHYSLPWGEGVKAVAKEDISLFVWRGMPVKTSLELQSKNPPLEKGAEVGSVSVISNGRSTKTSVVLDQKMPAAPWHWRLLH